MRRYVLPVLLAIVVLLIAQYSIADKKIFADKKIYGSGNVIVEERVVKDFSGVKLATIGKLYIEVGKKEKLEIEAEDNLLPYLQTEVDDGMLVIRTKKEEVNLKPKKLIRYFLTVKELNEIKISSTGDVEVPDLSADRFTIISSSAGDIEMGDLETNSLRVKMSSAGDVTIDDVSAKDVEISISSAGDLKMGELETNTLKVNIESAGDAKIIELFAEEFNLLNSSAGTMVVKDGRVKKQYIILSSAGDYKAKNLESLKAIVRLSSTGSATINVRDYLDATLSSMGSLYYLGSPELDSRVTSLGKIRKIRD